MANKIPTAEEFITSSYGTLPPDMPYGVVMDGFKKTLIAFAKLHVKAAIKECIESAPSGSSTDTVSYEDVVECLEDCYPLTNIK